jgi:hypothetical protein
MRPELGRAVAPIRVPQVPTEARRGDKPGGGGNTGKWRRKAARNRRKQVGV